MRRSRPKPPAPKPSKSAAQFSGRNAKNEVALQTSSKAPIPPDRAPTMKNVLPTVLCALTGQAGKMLRGEIPFSKQMPVREQLGRGQCMATKRHGKTRRAKPEIRKSKSEIRNKSKWMELEEVEKRGRATFSALFAPLRLGRALERGRDQVEISSNAMRSGASGEFQRLQNGILRYGRLKICVTLVGRFQPTR